MHKVRSHLGKKASIVFLDKASLPPSVVFKTPSIEHELQVYDSSPHETIAARIADADVVITNKAPLDALAIAGCRNLKLVAVAATGYDNVDIAACNAMGITISNVRAYAASTVPEHTFALILALRRGLKAYERSIENGAWQKSEQFCYFESPIHDLSGSTLGIVGDGVIGQAVGAIGRAFGMRVLYAAFKGTKAMGSLYTGFEEVLRTSDVITLHCPLLPSTHNLIGADEFALMRRKPMLINTARGGLVDEFALAQALESGALSGAAFDVATEEPPSHEHPLMKLRAHQNFILTPHIAWASVEASQSLADQLVENIERFWTGHPRNVVQ